MRSSVRRRGIAVLGTLGLLGGLVAVSAAGSSPTALANGQGHGQDTKPKAVFFASDGLRQDLVKKYANQGLMPTMRSFIRNGVRAAEDGLLTQAPPNTGAGWYTLATGAWPGVHGSTNNTFHKNGEAFASRTAAFDPGVLQAESIAQAAERGGLKVAQIEWAGGRNASINGPTIDYQTFHSGRGVATNYVGGRTTPVRRPGFVAAFGLQFDHPAGFGRPAPFPQAEPNAGHRLDQRARVEQPRHGDAAARARRRHRQVRPERLPLRQHRRRHHQLRPSAVLHHQGRQRRRRRLAEGEWADVKVTISGGALDGKTAGMLVRVEEMSDDLSRVRLFHTSVTRAIASWPSWPGEPGYTDFDEYLAQSSRPRRPPTSPSSRPASPASRPMSTRASTGRPATGR